MAPASRRSSKPKAKAEVALPEDEQWRLIRESGVLKNAIPEVATEEDTPLVEEIFNGIFIMIPFSFLLLMMEILIHRQYNQDPTFSVLLNRLFPNAPILWFFIFYTSRYKAHRRMQFFLFILSSVVGPRMIYLINRGDWLTNIKQCPPLATLWIYCVFQLELGPAVLSLLVGGSYVWWKGLKLVL